MYTKGKAAFGTVDLVTEGAAVMVELGKRNPLVAATVDVANGPGCADVTVEPPRSTGLVLEPVPGPGAVPPIVPVQTARTGQHATFPAASRAQA